VARCFRFAPAFAGNSWLDLLIRGAQVIQLYNISDEVQLGKQINQQLLGSKFQLYRNPDVNRYIDQIGQQLAASSQRPDIPPVLRITVSMPLPQREGLSMLLLAGSCRQ